MSQTEIAKALGVKDRSSISGYERGEREPPLPTLLAYARLVKASVESLIDLGEHPKAAIHEHRKTGHREVVAQGR